MKKIIITIIVALACIESHAQTEKGKFFIGGSMGFNSESNQSNKDIKGSNFSILPSVGYFVANRFALGFGIGYGSFKNTYLNQDFQGNSILVKATGSNFSIMPSIRYFVPIVDGKFFFSPSLGTYFSFGKTKNSFTNNTFPENIFSISANPGFSYFPTEHWGINLNVGGLSYRVINPKGDNNNTSNLNFGLGSGANIGINYFF